MRSFTGPILLGLFLVSGCSHTVLVTVPPRMELKGYGTLGVIEFSSNSGLGSARATQQLQEQIQSAQPGTRFIELGSRETVLAAVGPKVSSMPTPRSASAGSTASTRCSSARSPTRTRRPTSAVNDLAKLDAGRAHGGEGRHFRPAA
jgi:hypothetical protein